MIDSKTYLQIQIENTVVSPCHCDSIVNFGTFFLFLKLLILGHIDDHMPAPDGICGIQTHDSWILRHGPYTLRHRYGLSIFQLDDPM